jgi:hypothetical protein
MEFKQWYYSLPKVSRTYMTCIVITTIIGSYLKIIPLIPYLRLDYEKILYLQVIYFNISYGDYSLHLFFSANFHSIGYIL